MEQSNKRSKIITDSSVKMYLLEKMGSFIHIRDLEATLSSYFDK